MNKSSYKNRNGDEITFTKISNKVIEMSGHNSEHMKMGTNPKTQELVMIDPSGGPYLYLGQKFFDTGFEIKALTTLQEVVLIHLK